MLPKGHMSSHSKMSGSRWVITPSWLSGSWRSFLYSSSVYSCHLLISFASVTAKSLQLCPTLCDPIDSSPPGSPVPGILQARTLEWVAISFSSAWKWKVKVISLSRVRLLVTPWTAAYQAPPSMGFSRQEYWSGLPLLLLSPYNFCALLSPSLHEMFPCISNFLEEISSLSHSVLFLYFFALISEEGFLISPCYSLELCIIFPFLLCFSFLFFSQLFVGPPQTAILLFCISFS